MKPYPNPLVFPASKGDEHHTHTLIFLHGRGSNAERFGQELMFSASLATRLPTVKFVFPTARKRRSTVLKRMPIHQWYDNYSLDDPNERTDLQIDGLAESGYVLRTLIDREASLLGDGEEGYRRVLLGGLSQGCAMASFALLGGLAGTYRLGALIGMSGWLPFQEQLSDILSIQETHASPSTDDVSDSGIDNASNKSVTPSDSDTDTESESDKSDETDEDDVTDQIEKSDLDDTDHLVRLSRHQTEEDDFDPFGHDSDDEATQEQETKTPRPLQALNHVRDILELPPLKTAPQLPDGATPPIHYLKTPVFLGHGRADPKVSVKLGEGLAKTLSTGFSMDVTWRSYKDFGHWYKVPDEIDDMLEFLERKTHVLVEEASQDDKNVAGT